ncbi:MAG: helix-turn-helix transcriptional regulator [Clostridia bacterium]|nr:helix-turn-helix transcriptional regulator [Clostridia bacterium]
MNQNENRIGKNIAELRKRDHLTQEQVAKLLNVSPQAVSKWENGISLPDTEMMPKIAAVFGTNMDYLYFGRASAASGVPAADGGNVLDRSKQLHANRLIYYYFREEDVDALTDEEFIVLQRKLKNEVSSITGIHAAFVDFYAGVNGDDIRGNGDWTDYQIFKRKNIVDDTSKMWIFDVYERLFTMGKLLGVKHFFDLDCRTAALQSMILMYDGEMHYTGIDDNIFHQYIDNFHTEPEYVNEVFRRFTGGKERIRYIKGKYPCPLEIPENNMLLLPFFGLHPNMKVPGFFNAKTHEELLSAMSRDFERVVLMLRGTINNPELKNIKPTELVYNDIPVEVNCFDREYDFIRQNMPGFEFYRMGKTKRGNIIIFGTRVPTDRVILEREYTVVGDLLLSYVIDKHWHEMILE